MTLIVGVAVFYMLAVVSLLVLSRVAQQEALRSRKAREVAPGALEFAAENSALLASQALIGLFALLGVGGLLESAFTGRGLLPGLFCAGFALLLAKLMPGTIVLLPDGLEQRYWLGKPKQMRWRDVQEVIVLGKQRRVIVRGRGDVKILHTKQLPDQERLLAELGAHCPDAMPGQEGVAPHPRHFVIPPPPPPAVEQPKVEPPSVPRG